MSFDQRWQTEVYKKNLQINKYPFHQVVSVVLHYFSKEKDRSKINILELGCGTANNIHFLAQEGFNATGLDGSEHAIELGRTFLDENGLNATLLCQDFTNLSNFADQSFDMVIDRGSITHNRKKTIETTISEVYRVLKSNGIFLSHIFSTKHSAIEYGEPYGDGSYNSFEGGFYSGESFTFFFASEQDIIELYESKFTMVSKIHNVMEEKMSNGDDYRAMWNLTCHKP